MLFLTIVVYFLLNIYLGQFSKIMSLLAALFCRVNKSLSKRNNPKPSLPTHSNCVSISETELRCIGEDFQLFVARLLKILT